MEQFQLFRGGVVLGVVTLAPDERVNGGTWDVGWLVPSSAFEGIRQQFDSEQQLLKWAVRSEEDPDREKGKRRSEWLLDLAAGVQREIMHPGIWIVSLADARRINASELHVEAGKVFWR
jgi:hypothetical protein